MAADRRGAGAGQGGGEEPAGRLGSKNRLAAGAPHPGPTLPGTNRSLGRDSLDGYRVARIAELLAGRRDWDVAAALRMQLDQQSLPWREMGAAGIGALGGG